MNTVQERTDWSVGLKAVADFSRAMSDWGRAFVVALEPWARRFAEGCAELHQAAKVRYMAAGAPYGDSDEGMMRWLSDGAALLNAARCEYPLELLRDAASEGTGKTDAEG